MAEDFSISFCPEQHSGRCQGLFMPVSGQCVDIVPVEEESSIEVFFCKVGSQFFLSRAAGLRIQSRWGAVVHSGRIGRTQSRIQVPDDGRVALKRRKFPCRSLDPAPTLTTCENTVSFSGVCLSQHSLLFPSPPKFLRWGKIVFLKCRKGKKLTESSVIL